MLCRDEEEEEEGDGEEGDGEVSRKSKTESLFGLYLSLQVCAERGTFLALLRLGAAGGNTRQQDRMSQTAGG